MNKNTDETTIKNTIIIRGKITSEITDSIFNGLNNLYKYSMIDDKFTAIKLEPKIITWWKFFQGYINNKSVSLMDIKHDDYPKLIKLCERIKHDEMTVNLTNDEYNNLSDRFKHFTILYNDAEVNKPVNKPINKPIINKPIINKPIIKITETDNINEPELLNSSIPSVKYFGTGEFGLSYSIIPLDELMNTKQYQSLPLGAKLLLIEMISKYNKVKQKDNQDEFYFTESDCKSLSNNGFKQSLKTIISKKFFIKTGFKNHMNVFKPSRLWILNNDIDINNNITEKINEEYEKDEFDYDIFEDNNEEEKEEDNIIFEF